MKRLIYAILPAAVVLFSFLVVPSALAGGDGDDTTKGGSAAGRKNATPPADLCGRLSTHEGLPVLEVWGSPEQAGFAHGWLLADPIVALFDDYILDPKIVRNPYLYETLLIPSVRRKLVWDKPYERELQAMCDGVVARLGRENVRSEKLGRELGLADLMIANALADWHGMFCSSFSAWGALTADGQTITARNLDFPSTPAMERNQIVLVYRGDGTRAGWVGVTWPGLIGVYTAMNDAGVTMLMHDARGLPASETDGFTPRSLILREALEAARTGSYLDDVQRIFAARRVMVGNNIHVSGPSPAAPPAGLPAPDAPPAAVFEFDGNERDAGVSRRAPDADVAGGQALFCTNHMCERIAQQPSRSSNSWDRYISLEKALGELCDDGRRLDAADALRLIDGVRRRDTLHSVVCLPSRRIIRVRAPAVVDSVVEFRVDEWLARR